MEFKEGYKRGIEVFANEYGVEKGVDIEKLEKHSEELQKITDELKDQMNKKINMKDDNIRGFLFEEYTAGGFNLDAISKEKPYYAIMRNDNDKIIDVEIFDTETNEVVRIFQLKNAEFDTIKNSIKKRPGYAHTDGLIMNTDVFEKVNEYLFNEVTNSQSQSEEEMFKNLLRISDTKIKIEDDGVVITSLAISKEKMHEMVKTMREQVDRYGEIRQLEINKFFDINNYYPKSLIFKNSIEAGVNAALITYLIKIIPHFIDSLINDKNISLENIQDIIMDEKGEVFFRGALTSSITMLCKSGYLGDKYININNNTIAGIVILSMQTMSNIRNSIRGEISYSEAIEKTLKDTLLLAFIMKGKAIGANMGLFSANPLIGSIIGSFIGSIIGASAVKLYDYGIVYFAKKYGLTYFKLVEQSYELPDDILENSGLDLVKLDSYEDDYISIETYEDNITILNTVKSDYIELDNRMLNRGLIKARVIGYV